jgi:hypothetical protein
MYELQTHRTCAVPLGQALGQDGVPEFVLLMGKCGSLLRKDKRRMNFIHAGPFDSAALRSG